LGSPRHEHRRRRETALVERVAHMKLCVGPMFGGRNHEIFWEADSPHRRGKTPRRLRHVRRACDPDDGGRGWGRCAWLPGELLHGSPSGYETDWIPTNRRGLLTSGQALEATRRTVYSSEAEVTGRETLFAVGGGVGVIVGLLGLASSRRAPVQESAAPEDRVREVDSSAADPAMIANTNLAESLRECSRQVARLTDEKTLLEQQISDERAAEADASRAAVARRIARRDLSQSDWGELMRTGTIRYVLPCASFNPDPETISRLGLAPRDVLVIHDAFDAARNAAWAQIRPLCATALGNAGQADTLGLDLCPKMILETAKAADPRAADGAMRAVAAVRAGLADPSTIPLNNLVGTTFLVMTAVAKDAELRIGSQLGSDDARATVYGNNGCSHTTEFNGPGPTADRGSQGDRSVP